WAARTAMIDAWAASNAVCGCIWSWWAAHLLCKLLDWSVTIAIALLHELGCIIAALLLADWNNAGKINGLLNNGLDDGTRWAADLWTWACMMSS
ncbi:hypothetical protein Dimus_019084, partial [Dionaea muscipula]